MRKDQWIELVQSNAGLRYRDRTIALHIEQAINTVLGQIFNKDPQQWDLFAKPYEADIVSGVRPYALLPEQIIQVPDVANGVRRIYPAGGGDLVFMPMPAHGHQLFREVGLDQVDDTIGYDVRADRVWFFNLRAPIVNITMDLVIPFGRWAFTDDFPIPMGTANTITDIAVKTLQSMPGDRNIYKTDHQ